MKWSRIGLDLLRDVFVQARVGQQTRLGQMRAILRNVSTVRQRRGLETIQLRIGCRLSAASVGNRFRAILRVKEVLVGAHDGAVIRRCIAALWSSVS